MDWVEHSEEWSHVFMKNNGSDQMEKGQDLIWIMKRSTTLGLGLGFDLGNEQKHKFRVRVRVRVFPQFSSE